MPSKPTTLKIPKNDKNLAFFRQNKKKCYTTLASEEQLQKMIVISTWHVMLFVMFNLYQCSVLSVFVIFLKTFEAFHMTRHFKMYRQEAVKPHITHAKKKTHIEQHSFQCSLKTAH